MAVLFFPSSSSSFFLLEREDARGAGQASREKVLLFFSCAGALACSLGRCVDVDVAQQAFGLRLCAYTPIFVFTSTNGH